MKAINLGIVGATGMVGRKLLDLLAKSEIAEQKTQIDLEKIRSQSLEKVMNMENLDDRQRSMKLIDVMSKAIMEDTKQEKNN